MPHLMPSWPVEVWTVLGVLTLPLAWLLWLMLRLSGRVTEIRNRFETLQGNDERLERGMREELALNRREVAASLGETREELNRAIERLSAALSGQGERLRQRVEDTLNQAQQDARAGRTEQGESLRGRPAGPGSA